MKTFSLPKAPEALLFDIDGTLYTSPGYVEEQVRVQVERFGELKGWTYGRALEEIERAKRDYAERTGGKKTSLANAMLALGIPIEESVRWREELLRPEEWLGGNPGVDASLAALGSAFRLCAVTNNTEGIGRRTLRAIGIEARFEFVVGLDTSGASKPAREPFEIALKRLGRGAASCVSVGDRFDVDIEVPLAMGMGGILVDGAEDIIRLPGLLLPSAG
jgi:HAD superfamily hydrolase (TIGR01549 family)